MIITSKRLFYEMQYLGLFNTPRYWDTLEEVETEGTITARNSLTPESLTHYCKPVDVMKRIFETVDPQDYKFLEDPPDSRTLQGEFTRLNGGWYLKYNRENGPLGSTLPGIHTVVQGASALSILRGHLDGSSFDDLMTLTDMFGDPYHVDTPVIEFSAFHCPVGQMKGRNTIIWEVRSY